MAEGLGRAGRGATRPEALLQLQEKAMRPSHGWTLQLLPPGLGRR